MISGNLSLGEGQQHTPALFVDNLQLCVKSPPQSQSATARCRVDI